jgi:hypothetical protein
MMPSVESTFAINWSLELPVLNKLNPGWTIKVFRVGGTFLEI